MESIIISMCFAAIAIVLIYAVRRAGKSNEVAFRASKEEEER